jgi:hypothetical protein
MANQISTASRVLNAEMIANLASDAISSQPRRIQELLLTSKSEQTFSGLLAHQLSNFEPLVLGKAGDPNSGSVLLEFKGKDYKRKTSNGVKNSRNFHDISIANEQGEFEVIIENKFWYHFDGCKGKKNPKPEKGIRQQIEGDIFKINQTLGGDPYGKKGFLLLNIVTPGDITVFPSSYRKDHDIVLKRTSGDMKLYRSQGLQGVLSVLEHFDENTDSSSSIQSHSLENGGFIDFICIQIKLS